MVVDIGENLIFYETAREIWEVAKKIFVNNKNSSELFGIKAIFMIFVREISITHYFNLLTR